MTLVVYGRRLEQVPAWPRLVDWLARGPGEAGQRTLSVARILIYDNSPSAMVVMQGEIEGCTCVHDSRNGGTAAAYARAASMAESEDIDWLLLLDQDTVLPADFLELTSAALGDEILDPPCAVIPWVQDAGTPISPSTVSRFGTIRPIRRGQSPGTKHMMTAIASGSLLSSRALNSIFPPPAALWLDYVDHWIFLQFHRRGWRSDISGACLDHDLSVLHPADLSGPRLAGILAAEGTFYELLGPAARAIRPIRFLARAMRYATLRPALAVLILQAMWNGYGKSRR